MTKLPYVVECKSFAAFFEPIAAFNVLSVALLYAEDCGKSNRNFEYRVVSRRGIHKNFPKK